MHTSLINFGIRELRTSKDHMNCNLDQTIIRLRFTQTQSKEFEPSMANENIITKRKIQARKNGMVFLSTKIWSRRKKNSGGVVCLNNELKSSIYRLKAGLPRSCETSPSQLRRLRK